MAARHGITVEIANDALSDPSRVVIDPDYGSASGRSVRVIGFSIRAAAVITVHVLKDNGVECGVNGWLANVRDQRMHEGDVRDGQD